MERESRILLHISSLYGEYNTFYSISVFQFGFDGNYNNVHLTHNYKNNSFAYKVTHNNNALLGFKWELDHYTRKQVLEHVGYSKNDFNNCFDTIIKVILISLAACVIFPIQKIMKFGSDTRMNVPEITKRKLWLQNNQATA